jgi:hypothetical protein
MSYYAVTLSLTGPLAAAVAVEWTNLPAPSASGQGWEPCLRQPDGTWRLASHDPSAGLHRRGPGRFADLAIRYRLEPAGPWSAASLGRKEIVVLKVEEDEEQGLLVGPVVATLPGLLGTGMIGTELALDPGLWTGFPAPALTFQWRRDGVPIPGASARAYAPVAADDGCGIDCLVAAASPAGRAEAATPAVGVRYAAPTRRADLAEEVFDEADAPERVETAPAFAGENLSFSAEGAAGLSIDARSGVLSLPVDAPVSGGVVTVTARNSGGAATATLRYTVEGVPGRRLGTGDVTVLRSLWRPAGQSVTFSPEIAFPGLAGETVQAIEFTNDAVGATAPVWHPVRAKAGAAGVWQLFDRGDPVGPGRADAALWGPTTPRSGRLRFRWRVSQLHPWSDAGAPLAVPAVVAMEPEADFTVSTRTELVAAMNAAVSGNVIAMQPGTYPGTISFTNKNKGNPGITVRPVNRANPPVILNGTVDVSGSTGITFDGLVIRMTIKDTSPTYYGDGPYLYPATKAIGGFNGADVRKTTRITFRNCVFEGHHIAIDGAFTKDFVIEYCHITGCGMDSIRCYNTNDGFTLRNTLFDAPNVDLVRATAKNADGAARHPDFLQFANSEGSNYAGNSNFLIENNAFYASYGYHQAIFLYNEKCSRGTGTVAANGHNNGVIRGNYVESRHVHGITLSGTGNVLVENNLIRSKPPASTPNALGAVNPPDITITGTVSGAQPTGIVRNNVMPVRSGHEDNDLRRLASTSSQTFLTRTGNKRSATAEPIGWARPLVGPYAYQ